MFALDMLTAHYVCLNAAGSLFSVKLIVVFTLPGLHKQRGEFQGSDVMACERGVGGKLACSVTWLNSRGCSKCQVHE